MSDLRLRELARRAAAGDPESRVRLLRARLRARAFTAEGALVAPSLDGSFASLRAGVERGGWSKATRIRVALAVLGPAIDRFTRARELVSLRVVGAIQEWLRRPCDDTRRAAGRAATEGHKRSFSLHQTPDGHLIRLAHAVASRADDTVRRACLDAFEWATDYEAVRGELLEWAVGLEARLDRFNR